MRGCFHLAVAGTLLAAGCANPQRGGPPRRSPAFSPSAERIEGAGLTPDEGRQAKAIYNLKCARCHKFYDPAHYDDVEWRSWMTKMSRKARLKPDQDRLLSRYLDAFRPLAEGSPTKLAPDR